VLTPVGGEEESMSYELVVGLQVDDAETYRRYRAEMKPLLDSAGGAFRYDFEIARTLVNGSQHEINRVFVLAFPNAETKARFFADPSYRAIRSRLYEGSVGGTTIIAEYTR
jgi:uncharacterized protein (DUF1330 family)